MYSFFSFNAKNKKNMKNWGYVCLFTHIMYLSNEHFSIMTKATTTKTRKRNIMRLWMSRTITSNENVVYSINKRKKKKTNDLLTNVKRNWFWWIAMHVFHSSIRFFYGLSTSTITKFFIHKMTKSLFIKSGSNFFSTYFSNSIHSLFFFFFVFHSMFKVFYFVFPFRSLYYKLYLKCI